MFKIATIVWMMAGTTLAGIAIMVVLSVPALAVHDMRYIPIVGVLGFVVAVPLAYFVARHIVAQTRT